MHICSSHCFFKPVTPRAQLLVTILSFVSHKLYLSLTSVGLALRGGLFALPLLLGVSPILKAADLNLTVDNITDTKGTLYWSIFDSEESYNTEENPLLAGRSRVIGERLQITLHDLPAGDYAVKLFHDANDNGEMDSNLLGLPQEGYGFSNNAGNFGPASFSEAKVELNGNIQITIRLR